MRKYIIRVGYKKNYVVTYNVECEEMADVMVMARAMSEREQVSYASVTDIKTGAHQMYIDI